MKMKQKPIQEIPFTQMASRHYIPWLMALLVFLLTLLLSGTFSMGVSLSSFLKSHSQKISIELPVNGESNREHLNKTLAQVREIVEPIPGFIEMEEVSSEKMVELIRPWIGPLETIADLQLPFIVDVKFSDETNLDTVGLTKQLREICAGARIESFGKWKDNLKILSQSFTLFAYLVVSFIILTTATMVVLIAKSSLTAYRHILNVLRLMGAKDSYIANQFQNQSFYLVLKGSFMGIGLALPVIVFFAWFANYFEIPYIYRSLPSFYNLAVIFLIPFVMASLCLLVARLAVLRTLNQLNIE
jgi:cell division transport system permease protein